ncbi:MAG: glutamyl-tRNA reductase [Chloroflexota bacterium]|jgi:glutamyl-tRNA reductase|nr:glutamyl-tRNA reductase [Chloroflexota bacterium]
MITLLGIDHHSAPVALRERLAFVEDEIPGALRELTSTADEAYLLSTCNRTEIYAVGAEHPISSLIGFIAEQRGVNPNELTGHSYAREGSAAVEHLLRVASGIESMVLGETQILGQVRDAYQTARDAGTIGRVLGRALPLALEAGKRARTETAISRGALSASSVAVDLAHRLLDGLGGRAVLVIGAGEAGEATVRALIEGGAGDIIVANRSPERAERLASTLQGRAVPFTDLQHALEQVDIVISSTGAPEHIVTYDLVRRAMDERPDRPLFCIDIAVPRDVDPAVVELPSVVLYNIDDLEALCAANLQVRKREATAVERIIGEALDDFRQWETTEQVIPMIGELYQRAETIRQTELERTLRRLPSLSDEERAMLDAMTASIVRRLLHTPVSVLKSSQEGPDGDAIASAMQQLFKLAREEVAGVGAERAP